MGIGEMASKTKVVCDFFPCFVTPTETLLSLLFFSIIFNNHFPSLVWPVLDREPSTLLQEKKVALKTIRWEHDYDERNFHRHIRDAIVSERLSSSPRVTSMYAFCGNSGYYDFAGGGSLSDRLEEHWGALDSIANEEGGRDQNVIQGLLSQYDKLSLAYEAANALSDLHDTDAMRDKNGEIISASMVHADITADQFIIIDGGYKLNDFNRCRFMRSYRGTAKSEGGDGKPCGFYVGSNPGTNRSPEEYAYEEETEKVDIYSLGNVFYMVLTDEIAFDDMSSKKATKAIQNGERAEIPSNILSSNDPVNVALRTVVKQCWEQDPKDRPRARALADYLHKELQALDKSKEKIAKEQ